MNTPKVYELLKDTICYSGGSYHIVKAGEQFTELGEMCKSKNGWFYFREFVENNPEWFKLVRPVDTRIEVYDIYSGKLSKEYYLNMATTKEVPQDKYPAIKQVVEDVLNEKPQDAYLNLNLRPNPYRYTEEDLAKVARHAVLNPMLSSLDVAQDYIKTIKG